MKNDPCQTHLNFHQLTPPQNEIILKKESANSGNWPISAFHKEIISKKRTFISRIENDASNMTLKTLYDIVEKGLGGKIKIQIEI